MKLSEFDEAELRVQTQNMYAAGGAENVLEAVLTMQRCAVVILKKLNEILENENNEKIL